jgi:hypothetical protein
MIKREFYVLGITKKSVYFIIKVNHVIYFIFVCLKTVHKEIGVVLLIFVNKIVNVKV